MIITCKIQGRWPYLGFQNHKLMTTKIYEKPRSKCFFDSQQYTFLTTDRAEFSSLSLYDVSLCD